MALVKQVYLLLYIEQSKVMPFKDSLKPAHLSIDLIHMTRQKLSMKSMVRQLSINTVDKDGERLLERILNYSIQ